MNPITPLALLISTLALTGCVSAKYKLTKPEDAKPAVALNLAVTQPPVETMLNTVIVYQGPGSWKRDAYWDEYMLTVSNHGTTPLTVESASLTGLANITAAPAAEPWALEKKSQQAVQTDYALVLNDNDVAVQIGGGLATATAATAVGAGYALATGASFSGLGAPLVLAGGIVIVAPLYAGGAIYRNLTNRHEVEREFQRRSLVLPATLASSQIAQGSLFFPITPGPQRLILHCRVGNEPRDVTFDLTPLAGLHLKKRAGLPPPASEWPLPASENFTPKSIYR